ncbi:hypothetical protein, partial [Rickettsia sp. wb]
SFPVIAQYLIYTSLNLTVPWWLANRTTYFHHSNHSQLITNILNIKFIIHICIFSYNIFS